MSRCTFKLLEERIKILPSYRWLSFWPFTIECDDESNNIPDVFEQILENEAFKRPYIFNGPAHGPFPVGELNADDYEKLTSAEVKQNVKKALIGKASWMDEPDPPDAEVLAEVDRWLEDILLISA